MSPVETIDTQTATRKAPKYVPVRTERPQQYFAGHPNGAKLRVCLLIIALLTVIGICLCVALLYLYFKRFVSQSPKKP